ncbi:MAG: hypothetical protein IKV47_01070 [Oscillospiraceae bacterium]|nr:hypothetical protein [Oscillospiraceae bacterium]
MANPAYKRRFGDRKEGRLLRSLSPFYKIMSFIMVKRNDAMNDFEDSIEVTELDRWLREKRVEGYKGLGMLHVFIAAYVRTVAYRPSLNRFVSGQRVYARNNIEVVMAIKKSLSTDAAETTIKVIFEPTDTIYDVYRKLNEKVDEVKSDNGENNTERTASAFMKIPRLILKFAIWLVNLLDYFGLLPQALLDASPFHGSMIISDLGSLGIPPIYHHIYNFGNLPLFICFGAKRRVMELDDEGTPTKRKYVDYKVTMDERIVDGLYYATAFKYIKYYLHNPAGLELPPEKVDEDIL